MTSKLAERLAVPPTYRHLPPSVTSGGHEAVDLASSAGLDLDPWQIDALIDVMAEGADGSWAARIVVLVVPRQNGKGSILEALELCHLFLIPSTRLIIHSAHEQATSSEHFDRIVALIDETPDLKRRLPRNGIKRARGSEGIHLRNGKRLLFKTRTSGGGRGFSGDLVVFDEAMKLPPDAVSALVPTMSAMPNPQVVLAGSAPLPSSDSDVLRGLILQGRRGDADDLALLEWCCAEGADLDDPEEHQRANPGYPVRIGPRAIAVERTMMALDPEGFARERLGIWREDEGGPAVIPVKAWRDCFNERSGVDESGRAAIALDMPPDRDHVTFAAVGASPVGGDHLEVVDVVPTAQAVARAKALHSRWSTPIVIGKSSPAASLASDLADAGVEVRWVTAEEYAQACGDLLDSVRAQTVHHLDDPVLNAAVAGAAAKPYGDGSWSLCRRTSTADISPLVAVTLARWVHKTDLPTDPALAAY